MMFELRWLVIVTLPGYGQPESRERVLQYRLMRGQSARDPQWTEWFDVPEDVEYLQP